MRKCGALVEQLLVNSGVLKPRSVVGWRFNGSGHLGISKRAWYSSTSTTFVQSDSLKLHKDGQSHSFLYFWLRDNCKCNNCLHPETQQRQIDTMKIPEDIKPKSVTINSANTPTESLVLEWEDGHKSTFSTTYLQECASEYFKNQNGSQRLTIGDIAPIFWNKTMIESRIPEMNYNDIMNNDNALLEWLNLIQIYGFSLVRSAPPTPEATRQLAEKISFLRSTMFGTFWDYSISSSESWKLQHCDTAYTSLAIEPHTDGCYYLDSPGLQFFHVLEFDRISGGETILLDGFYVGEKLRKTDPDAFKFLSTHPMLFRYYDKDKINLSIPQPMISVNSDGEIVQIRYNNHDRAPNYLPPELAKQYYSSLRTFLKEIQNPDNQLKFVLQPGNILITNNWRVFHARDEFVGIRRICGCYLGIEDFQSKLRVLQEKRANHNKE